MIELADTTFRAYKKRSGFISLHLRSFLLVHTGVGFRLSAYLKEVRCWITLPGSKEQAFDSVSIGDAPECNLDRGIMAHSLRISGLIPPRTLRPCVADFRMRYKITFRGHETDKSKTIKRKVLVIPGSR